MRSRPCTRRSSSGPRKLKCHSIGLRVMLSQSPIPGSGASITTQRVTPDRILSSQRIADHIADVMCDQVCLLDLECVHDAGNVDCLALLGVGGIRVVEPTHTAQVGDDDGMVLGDNNYQGGSYISHKTDA